MRATAPHPKPAAAARGGIVFWLLFLLFLTCIALVVYLARRPLLRATGEWWVVSEELEKAQAIIVLGGDSVRGDRVQRAAQLYQDGWAPRVVLIGPTLRIYLNETELMQREAIALGVPRDKVLTVPHPASSTLEEALLLRPFFAQHGFRRVIVVTSNFHARRARRIFHAVYRERGTQVWVEGVDDPRFDPRRWWQDREQRAIFLEELLKSLNTWWELGRVPPPATVFGGRSLLLPTTVL